MPTKAGGSATLVPLDLLDFDALDRLGLAVLVSGQKDRFGTLLVGRRELLHDGAACRVRHIGLHLSAQGAFAQRGQTVAQGLKSLALGGRGVLRPKAVGIAKDPVVDHADQAIQLQQ